MARTDATAVVALMLPGKDYDTRRSPSLTPFIDTANALVTRVATCAATKGITLSAAELELLERWLSAHFYCMSDQTYSSRSTGGASGSFHGQTGMALDATKYGQTAQMLDSSGCLVSLSKRQTAGAFWAGKRPSEQTAYEDRS